jgi:hypothetical protein
MTDDSDPKKKITRLFEQTVPRPAAAPSIVQSGTGNIIAFGNVSIGQEGRRAPRVTVAANPGIDHITETQKTTLKQIVSDVVATEARLKKSPKSHGAVWSAVNKACGVTSYHLIALEDFETARGYLNSWLGRLNGMKSAPVKNGDAYRRRRYSYIKVNTKHPEDAAALDAYILKKFKVTSISELSNPELEQAYRYVASRKSRR